MSWGVDLASEHERFLTEKVYKQPLIVYNYPKDIKVRWAVHSSNQGAFHCQRRQPFCSMIVLLHAIVMLEGHRLILSFLKADTCAFGSIMLPSARVNWAAALDVGLTERTLRAGSQAFYMRLNDDGKTVAAMDVLVPKIGELIGGAQREERLEVCCQITCLLHIWKCCLSVQSGARWLSECTWGQAYFTSANARLHDIGRAQFISRTLVKRLHS